MKLQYTGQIGGNSRTEYRERLHDKTCNNKYNNNKNNNNKFCNIKRHSEHTA